MFFNHNYYHLYEMRQKGEFKYFHYCDKAHYKSLSGQCEQNSPFVLDKMKGYGDWERN